MVFLMFGLLKCLDCMQFMSRGRGRGTDELLVLLFISGDDDNQLRVVFL